MSNDDDSAPRKSGRPSVRNPELAARICERIAHGESLRAICGDPDMPSRTAVLKWLGEDEAFASQYARAREMQADHYADEITAIADTESDPNRARVRIDARKWVASKLRPKVYGDRLQLDGDVAVRMSDEQLDQRLRQLLAKAGFSGAVAMLTADDVANAL